MGTIIMCIGFIALSIFIVFGLCFMNLVMDVREDNKWDKKIRKERRKAKEYE